MSIVKLRYFDINCAIVSLGIIRFTKCCIYEPNN